MSELRIDTQLQPSNVSGSVLVTGLNKKPFYLAPGNSGTVLMSNGSGVIFSPIPDNVTDVGVNTNGENTISVFRSVDQANPEIYPMPPFGAKDTFGIRNITDSPYEIIFNTEKKTFYYYDPNDITSQDDNNYVLVTADNKVYKNIYEPRYDSELSNLNISIVDLYTNYNNVLSDITNVNQSITDLNIGYSDLNNGINTIQNDIDQIKLDLDEVVNVEDIYTKIEQLNFGNPITLDNFIANNNVGSNEKKILSGTLSKDIFLDIKDILDILNTNKFNNSGGFINGNVNIDGSINASTSFSFQGNPFITNTFGANSTSLRSISNTTNQPDGLYIGFANTNSAHTRIYDGGTTNSLELYNATVLTKNINKFLFGNQTDSEEGFQVSLNSRFKNNVTINGDINLISNTSCLKLESASSSGYAISIKNNYDAINRFSILQGTQPVFGHKVFGSLSTTYMDSYENLAFLTGDNNLSSSNIRMFIAQSGNIGINTTTPNISAILELNSTNKGLLLPRLTNTQKSNISTPPVGLVIYQLDSTEGIYVYTSDGFWRRLAFSDEVG